MLLQHILFLLLDCHGAAQLHVLLSVVHVTEDNRCWDIQCNGPSSALAACEQLVTSGMGPLMTACDMWHLTAKP